MGLGVFLLSGGNCGLLPGPRDGGGQKRYFILGCSLTASSENYIAPLSSSCIDHAWTSTLPVPILRCTLPTCGPGEGSGGPIL